jgi:uncharacterized protein (TIGR03435 family)
MYRIPLRQITGGPDWFSTDLYDIDAKGDHSYSLDDLHTMFQNLLADEFKLTFHKEIKEGNVYALTIDKSGLKMKVNETDQKFDIPITRSQNGIANGVRVPMQYLCWWLGQNLQQDERPVVDMTGLTKNYDFTLSFLPPLPPNFNTENIPPEILNRPSIFDALKQQLGLKLEPQKGPVDITSSTTSSGPPEIKKKRRVPAPAAFASSAFAHALPDFSSTLRMSAQEI